MLVTVAVSDIEPAKDIDKVDAVDVAPRSGSKPSKKSIKIVVDAAPVVDTAPLQAALSPFPSARGDKLLAAAKKDAVVAEALTCLVQSIAQLDSCVLVALGHRRNVATTSVFFTETLAALEAQGEQCMSIYFHHVLHWSIPMLDGNSPEIVVQGKSCLSTQSQQ